LGDNVPRRFEVCGETVPGVRGWRDALIDSGEEVWIGGFFVVIFSAATVSECQSTIFTNTIEKQRIDR
jgi:hypothetical protein